MDINTGSPQEAGNDSRTLGTVLTKLEFDKSKGITMCEKLEGIGKINCVNLPSRQISTSVSQKIQAPKKRSLYY